MKDIKKISLITDSLVEVKGNKMNIIQLIDSDYVMFEVNTLGSIYFTNPFMKDIAEPLEILSYGNIIHVRYWYDDGTFQLVELKDIKKIYRINIGSKLLIKIKCDTSNLLEVE